MSQVQIDPAQLARAASGLDDIVKGEDGGPSLDPERLLRELGAEGQAGSLLGEFHRRVADIQYNLDQLRRDLKSPL